MRSPIDFLPQGFLMKFPDPSLDLFADIEQIKKEKNAIILAHYYQEPDIQDVADFIGDSLGLAQEAQRTQADIILFAGVHFMAETAKMLNPTKKVLLPDLNAGCSLADSCPPDIFQKFKELHPEHKVISYINCSAEIKALSDVIVTSSNAEKIVNSFPITQQLIFAPDKNLGAWLNKKTGRDMLLWDGSCMVHEIFSEKKVLAELYKHPEACLIAHPECEAAILQHAHFIGSTTALLNFVSKSDKKIFVVATETGILHQMRINEPNKVFIPAPANNACACNDCPHMKLNTLEKVWMALKYEQPEIQMDESLRIKALAPILKMLELSI
jgi:quinolinate synthase